MDFAKNLDELLSSHPNVHTNIPRKALIYNAVNLGKALVTSNGALATWTPLDSTGRSPKDTLIVRRKESEQNIDWTSPNNIPLNPETFEMIFQDAMETLKGKNSFYVNDRVLGADSSYALPVRTITDRALTSVFVDNMFRPVPEDIEKSVFYNRPFTLIALPYDKLDRDKYEGRLRKLPGGETSNMVIICDMDNRIGIVYGSAYCGSCKKLMFTAMNYLLPEIGILPLHCSANEGQDGNCALLLGLSGTGKTTLSADPDRALLGDDEHGWNDEGIANFEYGCYAKLLNLEKEKEPEIFNALFHKNDYLEHGSIMENAMMYPDGWIDLDDDRLTPNSRASYPLRYLSNVKESSVSGHPSTILFLTADANGVLPPIARLTRDQAMLWFLMGYTSKLAGTETGIKEPVTTFSRFFGEPFMPRNPESYIKLLGEKLDKHGSNVYLVNTGWSGGAYGTGSRMDINITRALVTASLNRSLENVEYEEDKLFHVQVPKSCPGVESNILNPINTWANKDEFKYRAEKLAGEFAQHFDKAYSHHEDIPQSVRKACPGK